MGPTESSVDETELLLVRVLVRSSSDSHERIGECGDVELLVGLDGHVGGVDSLPCDIDGAEDVVPNCTVCAVVEVEEVAGDTEDESSIVEVGDTVGGIGGTVDGDSVAHLGSKRRHREECGDIVRSKLEGRHLEETISVSL
jgi:hypothetical protein